MNRRYTDHVCAGWQNVLTRCAWSRRSGSRVGKRDQAAAYAAARPCTTEIQAIEAWQRGELLPRSQRPIRVENSCYDRAAYVATGSDHATRILCSVIAARVAPGGVSPDLIPVHDDSLKGGQTIDPRRDWCAPPGLEAER